MKKFIVLPAVLFGLLFLTGAAFADENFVFSVLEGAFDLMEASGVKVSYRTRDGGSLPAGEDPTDSSVAYYQAKKSVAVLENWGGDVGVVLYSTSDRSARLPGGLKIGGPVAPALKPGLVPGKYSKDAAKDRVSHIWEGPVYVTSIVEAGGVIDSVLVIGKKEYNEITVVKDLAKYLP